MVVMVTVFQNGNGRHTELDNPGVRGSLILDAVRTF